MFSLKRYGDEVFTPTVQGRGCHSNGTGARFALKRYGEEVFTQTVQGGNLRLFMGNSWGMRGDFSLGIRSSEEVQLQAAQIDTHVKSLTKPRFPFHVRTGFLVVRAGLFFRSFFGVVFFMVFYRFFDDFLMFFGCIFILIFLWKSSRFFACFFKDVSMFFS